MLWRQNICSFNGLMYLYGTTFMYTFSFTAHNVWYCPYEPRGSNQSEFELKIKKKHD